MDTRYLQYFIVIAEERNMTKAAERLYVAQSSLSYQLNKLETEVGVPLFLRTKNDMILTPAGRLYLDAARHVIALKDRLYQNIADLDQRGHLRIAATSLWGDKLLERILPEFKKSFPDLTFEVYQFHDQATLRSDIAKGKLDFALISIPFLDTPDERTELLGTEELLFAVPAGHPYTKENPGDSITQEEIANRFFEETVLSSRRTYTNRQLTEQLYRTYKGELPPKLCAVGGLPLTCSVIAQNIGVALMPISGKSMEDKIHYYSCEPKIIRYNVMLHRENLVFNKPEQGFFDFVKEYYQKNIGPVVTKPL